MLKLVIRNRFSGERVVTRCKGMDAINAKLADFAWVRGWTWENAPCGWTYSISEAQSSPTGRPSKLT